jgi:hypothetical protein
MKIFGSIIVAILFVLIFSSLTIPGEIVQGSIVSKGGGKFYVKYKFGSRTRGGTYEECIESVEVDCARKGVWILGSVLCSEGRTRESVADNTWVYIDGENSKRWMEEKYPNIFEHVCK